MCFWSCKQVRDTIKLSGSYLKGNFSKECFGDTLLSLSLFTFSFTSILLLLEILLSLYYVISAVHEYIAVFYFYFWLYYGCFDFDSLLWLFYWQFFLNHELMKQRYNFPNRVELFPDNKAALCSRHVPWICSKAGSESEPFSLTDSLHESPRPSYPKVLGLPKNCAHSSSSLVDAMF